MSEPYTSHLEGSSAPTGLAPQAARLVSAPDCRGLGGQRGRRESMDGTRPAGRTTSPPAPPLTWCTAATDRRPTRAASHAARARPRSRWLSRTTLDPWPDCRRDAAGLWRHLSSASCRPFVRSDPVEPAKARATCPPAHRSGDCPLAPGDLACPHKGAQTQEQTLLFIDDSGFYPLPRVVRTYAPIGQTPIVREWWTRDHLSAISAISPEGKVSFRCQDHALNSEDVVAFLAHLLREVPGRMVMIWVGAPMHRSHLIQEFLADGAAKRLHLERLPADAPELNPGEGLWQQRKGVELRHVCGFNLPHLRGELRAAVKRVRRKPRILQGFFRGANL
jgi:transposase